MRTKRFPSLAKEGNRQLPFQEAFQRRHPGNFPFIPHLVHTLLDVLYVLRNEMGEAALRHQEFVDGNTAFRGFAGIIGVYDLTFDNLEKRVESRLDTELADFVRVPRMEIPTFGARI